MWAEKWYFGYKRAGKSYYCKQTKLVGSLKKEKEKKKLVRSKIWADMFLPKKIILKQNWADLDFWALALWALMQVINPLTMEEVVLSWA